MVQFMADEPQIKVIKLINDKQIWTSWQRTVRSHSIIGAHVKANNNSRYVLNS